MRLRFFAAGALALALFSPLTLHAEARAPEVKLPELIAPLAPEYPSNGTRNQRVILRVTLDTEGKVTGVDVTTGDEPFASAAVRAAQNGRFTPAERDGVVIPATILVAVDFTYSTPSAKPVSQTRATTRSGAKIANKEPQPALQMVEGEPLDIVVTAPRVDDTERAIQRAEARLMAGTFGDPLRAVELLPGITPLISGVPYFFVRGAPAGSVSFYIDDAKVPELYHVGPGSSILHPLFVEAVALRSGPYRARYGDATSGVITARVVRDVPEATGEVEAKAFESSAYAGTPLANGQASVAIGGKISHLEPLLKLINPDLHMRYWDYQALASYRITPRDQLSLLFLGAGDFVSQDDAGQTDIKIDSGFQRIKASYSRNLAHGVDLENYLSVGAERARFNSTNESFKTHSIGVGSALTYVASEQWEWASGLALDATDYDTSGAPAFIGEPNNIAVSRTDYQPAWWTEGRLSPEDRVHFDAGLRFSGYQSREAKALSIEPRISSTLDLSQYWKAILAVGYSTQAPTAVVPTPAVRPAELRGGVQQALARAATLRYAIPQVVTAEATGFYNEYLDLSDPLSLSTAPDPLQIGSTPEGAQPPQEDFNFTLHPKGRAFGLELMLRRPFSNRLSGTLAYTLSRSTRHIGGLDVPSSFDRTHVLNTTLGYNLGHGYYASTRFLTYSGLPVRRFGDTGGRTGDRSEAFVRWDLRFSKSFKTSWSDLMLIVEMLNTTFQDEVLGVSCFPEGCVTATFGPVSLPLIGLRGTFGGGRSDATAQGQFE